MKIVHKPTMNPPTFPNRNGEPARVRDYARHALPFPYDAEVWDVDRKIHAAIARMGARPFSALLEDSREYA